MSSILPNVVLRPRCALYYFRLRTWFAPQGIDDRIRHGSICVNFQAREWNRMGMIQERRLPAVLIVLAVALAVALAGYAIAFVALSGLEVFPGARRRRFEAEWQCRIFAPAAITEAWITGKDVETCHQRSVYLYYIRNSPD